MRKYYLFFLVMAFASAQFNAYAESDPVYCVPQGVNNTITNAKWLSGADARYIKTISVTGANFNGAPVENFTVNVESGPDRTPVVYYDRTGNILNTTLGDKLTVKWTKSANMTWMHYYVYVDYNNDGVFDETTEAVAWTYYQGKNSKGATVGEGTDFLQAPEFTIPETAKLGKTRIRFKVDWDCKHPCENTAANNYMYKNAGSVIDFTINIAKVKIPVVTITEPADGTLSIVKENGDAVISGTEVPSGTKLTITATPSSADKHLKYLLVNGEPVYTNEVTVTDDMTVSAVFTSDWYIKYSVSAGGTVALTKKADGSAVENEADLAPGTEVNVKLTPDEGYEIKTVTVNGEDAAGSFTEENNYTTTLTMTKHQNINVIFAKKQYDVILKQIGKWGALSIDNNNAMPNGNAVKIEHGTELTIIARPDPCEESWLERLNINGIDMTEELTEYTLAITILENTVIEATFAVPTYSVRFNLEGEAQITIQDEDTGESYKNAVAIPQNSRISWTITPAKDYKLESIKENGILINLNDLVNGKYELGRLDKDYVYDVVLSTTGTGINDLTKPSFSISSDNNWLLLSGIYPGDLITIIDTTGKLTKNINTNKTDISDLSAGCYIIQIIKNENITNMKFIKK